MTQTESLPTPAPVTAPAPVSEAQAAAWVGLAKSKNEIAYNLGTMELQAQAILLPIIESQDHAHIDAALAEYRKLHTAIVEARKPFTNAIDTGIVQPLMTFEKRVDPKVNSAYLDLQTRSLSLRKAEADKAALVNAKNQEAASFKAHVLNEFSRVVSQYRNQIRSVIQTMYTQSLES